MAIAKAITAQPNSVSSHSLPFPRTELKSLPPARSASQRVRAVLHCQQTRSAIALDVAVVGVLQNRRLCGRLHAVSGENPDQSSEASGEQPAAAGSQAGTGADRDGAPSPDSSEQAALTGAEEALQVAIQCSSVQGIGV